jgi:hypothetical protein
MVVSFKSPRNQKCARPAVMAGGFAALHNSHYRAIARDVKRLGTKFIAAHHQGGRNGRISGSSAAAIE